MPCFIAHNITHAHNKSSLASKFDMVAISKFEIVDMFLGDKSTVWCKKLSHISLIPTCHEWGLNQKA